MVAGVVSNLVKCSFALLVPLYAALACSSDSESPGGSGDGTQRPCEGAECGPTEPALEPICTSGSRYAPGIVAFREATDDWGLAELGVEGTRLSVGDVDGDGYADVFVRRGGNGSDDFAEDGTRRSWLLRNTGDGRFEDITLASGVRQTRMNDKLGRPGEVVAFADVDNDGDLDVYTGMSTGVDGALEGETSELLLNDGKGAFSFLSESNALRRAGEADIVAGAAFTDVDRDGNVDLWVGQHNYAPPNGFGTVFKADYLYRGEGGGEFSEVSRALGVTTKNWSGFDVLDEARAHSRAWSSAACDLNGDGTPELLTASYGRAPNHLWQGARGGDGNVTYTNRSVASGYAYDENMEWQSNEFAKCFCQANPEDEGCSDVDTPRVSCAQENWTHSQDRQAFRLGGNSGATICADVNNDGHLDLLTTEITHWWAGAGADRSELLINTGEADVRFTRPGGEATGIVREHSAVDWDQGDMSAAIFDFDNDGWPDVYIGASDYAGNHGLLFHQSEELTFSEVPILEGIDHNRSHGVAVADFDRDGDLDVIVGHSRSRCDASRSNNCYETPQTRFFENILGETGNWVQLELKGGAGTGANGAAIGARVNVTAGGITQTQEIGGGHGHYGAQQDTTLHFGLGEACTAEVSVRWPDVALTTQTFDVVSGYRYRLAPGEKPAAIIRDETASTSE